MTFLSKMNVFRERWWPYKAIALITVFFLTGANCLMDVNTVAKFMESPGIEYTHGVRASVFAIAALPRYSSPCFRRIKYRWMQI